jgi:CHAT domain-containing protein
MSGPAAAHGPQNPLDAFLDNWRTSARVAGPEAAVVARAAQILGAAAHLTAHPQLAQVRAGVSRNEPEALAALGTIHALLASGCASSLQAAVGYAQRGAWADALRQAELTAIVAAAVGRAPENLRALVLLGRARRQQHDPTGAIDANERAIELATRTGDDEQRAIACDNLGIVLGNVGRWDDAIARFDESRELEKNPRGRLAIEINAANALASLGEYSVALHRLRKAITELEASGTGRRDLAVALDNAGKVLSGMGEDDEALAAHERARTLFDPADLAGRAVNALARSRVHRDRGEEQEAGTAFEEAHDLAMKEGERRYDEAHYRDGFAHSLATRLPPADPAYPLFRQGVAAKGAHAWKEGTARFIQAAKHARAAGDYALALRAEANLAALLADAERVEDALVVVTSVQREAGGRGLAHPEAMATGTLASLAARGVEITLPAGVLGALASTVVLDKIHARVVSASHLTTEEALWETYDAGFVANQLGKLAREHLSRSLALRYFEEAVAKARSVQVPQLLLNRLSGLREVRAWAGDAAGADAIAAELLALVSNGNCPELGEIVARRDLAAHVADRDRSAAIAHLRRAVEIFKRLRQHAPPGHHRAEVSRQFQGLHRFLARLQRDSGDDRAAFDTLQGEKGRRLLDVRALRRGTPDTPPTANEVETLLQQLATDRPCALVDFLVTEDSLTAFVVAPGQPVRTVIVEGSAKALEVEHGDMREREVRLARCALESPMLAALVERVTKTVPADARLFLVPDGPLHNLPMHVVPVGGRPWCERAAIAFLPASGFLRVTPSTQGAAFASVVAGDSASNLPHAAKECASVGAALGAEVLVGPNCTRSALEQRLKQGPLEVIHLAVHGRGDGRRGGRSSLLLAAEGGGTEWVPFDELAKLQWNTRLVVFSGCSTAVAGPRQGNELVGVARAALEAGAGAVVACLWPVGDQAAEVLMTAFYSTLSRTRATGVTDLRVVLDEARAALDVWVRTNDQGRRRDGSRDLLPAGVTGPAVDPSVDRVLAWAPFVLYGDPVWR